MRRRRGSFTRRKGGCSAWCQHVVRGRELLGDNGEGAGVGAEVPAEAAEEERLLRGLGRRHRAHQIRALGAALARRPRRAFAMTGSGRVPTYAASNPNANGSHVGSRAGAAVRGCEGKFR
jgi:hypothetical protein